MADIWLGYAEVTCKGGPLRRYALRADILQGILTDEILGSTARTGIRVDPAQPLAGTDLEIALIPIINKFGPQRPGVTDLAITIRLRRRSDRDITEARIVVYVAGSISGVHPVDAGGNGAPGDHDFYVFSYEVAAGEKMPGEIVARLGTRLVKNAANVEQDRIDAQFDLKNPPPSGAPILRVGAGLVSGPIVKTPIIFTQFPGGVYSEAMQLPSTVFDAAAATTTMVADPVTLAEPGAPGLNLGGPVSVAIDQPRSAAGALVRPIATVAGPGGVTPGKHSYKVTFRHANGNESGGSLASVPIDVPGPGAKVSVQLPPLPKPSVDLLGVADPTMKVLARRVYRTVRSADGRSGAYFFAGEVPIPANPAEVVKFTDDKADSALAHALPGALVATYTAAKPLTVSAAVRIADPDDDDTYSVTLTAPKAATITMSTKTDGENRVQVRFGTEAAPATVASVDADVVLDPAAEPRSYVKARARAVPTLLDVAWRTRGDTQLLVEVDPHGATIDRVSFKQSSTPIMSLRDAPQDLCAEIVDRPAGSRLRVGVRNLAYARFALGEAGVHSVLGDGIKLKLRFPDSSLLRERPLRCLRLLRVTEEVRNGRTRGSHLSLRADELSDELDADVRLAGEPQTRIGLKLNGNAKRLKALIMTDPTNAFAAAGQRVWVTVPELGPHSDVQLGEDRVVLDLGARRFGEIAMRDPSLFGEDAIRHTVAAVSAPPRMTLRLGGEAGIVVDATGPDAGVSGRVALSTEVDQVLAVRATPQVRIRNLRAVNTPMSRLSLRAYKILTANLQTDGPTVARVVHLPDTPNRSFRARVDAPGFLAPHAIRDSVVARISKLPEVMAARLDFDAGVFSLTSNEAAGEGSVFAEPVVASTWGVLDGLHAGYGLVEGAFDRIPPTLKATIIGDDSQPAGERRPRNQALPGGWAPGGFKLQFDETFELGNVRIVTWSRDFLHEFDDDVDRWVRQWAKTKIRLLRLVRTGVAPPDVDPDGLSTMWLWTPSDHGPLREVDNDTGIGLRVAQGAEATLDLDSLQLDNDEKGTTLLFAPWYTLGAFRLAAELQLKDFRGEQTVFGEGTFPDTAEGPESESGDWFLRSIDKIPLGYDAFFGNTGGTFFSRPRIFT